MTKLLTWVIYQLLICFCSVSITASTDITLVSQRENVCGKKWISYKDEKCVKIIDKAKYDWESGATMCQSYTEVFDTDYSLLRIQDEDEQAFFSQLLFKEKGIKENVWLEYKVKDMEIPIVTVYNQTNLIEKPVDFSNWAKTNQKEKDGVCVQMLPGTNETEVGLWDRVNCRKLNIVVCERPQPVTMISLQAEIHQLKKINRLESKQQSIIKKCYKGGFEIHSIARGKPVNQSSMWDGNYFAHNGNDGVVTTTSCTRNGDRYPWWRIDLLHAYIVRQVAVYVVPTQEAFFHDVAIVVSNLDISTTPPMTLFNPSNESICEENIASNSALRAAWNVFECKQEVVGRYVSLQITADCRPGRTDCGYMWIQFADIEVFVVYPHVLKKEVKTIP